MSSPDANTFDLVPPRRPGTSDFNGIAKVDDLAYPPDPTTQPNAAEWNTVEFLLVALGKVCPLALISVTGGSPPTLFGFVSVSSSVLGSSITFTPNGAGDVSITWPPATFASSVTNPTANLNSGAAGMIDVVAIADGVRVRTYDAAGTAADLSFTVTLY